MQNTHVTLGAVCYETLQEKYLHTARAALVNLALVFFQPDLGLLQETPKVRKIV